MTVSLPQPAYILTSAGVRPGALIARLVDGRCRVRTRGSRTGRIMDGRLVFFSKAEADREWDRARAYRATLAAAGASRMRIVDVHLSLALAEAA